MNKLNIELWTVKELTKCQAHKQKYPGHDPGWQVVLLMMQEDLYLHCQVNQNPSLSIQ